MPNPILSSLTLPVKDADTQQISNVTFDFPSGGSSSDALRTSDLKSDTPSSLTAENKGSSASREYAVGLDADGKLSVNIPWQDTRDFKMGTTRSGASNNTLYFVYT